jgi:hypothetical protein
LNTLRLRPKMVAIFIAEAESLKRVYLPLEPMAL